MRQRGRPFFAWVSRPVFSREGIFFWAAGNVVKLRYTFFLVALLSGFSRARVDELLTWVVVVFLAILVHELGHAAAARMYGCDPLIELYTLGGLTRWTWRREPTLGSRLITSLAGPVAGFVAAGLMLGALRVVASTGLPYLARLAISDFLWVCVGWGLLNLLPVLPLDGGQALDALLEHRLGAGRGRYAARIASCVVGTIGALTGFAVAQPWAGFLLTFFTYNNLQSLRGLRGIRIAG